MKLGGMSTVMVPKILTAVSEMCGTFAHITPFDVPCCVEHAGSQCAVGFDLQRIVIHVFAIRIRYCSELVSGIQTKSFVTPGRRLATSHPIGK